MAPVQGMMHGLVPIVSAVSGVAEVLSDGVDGLILKDHLSPHELARLMQQLMDSPDALSAMSSCARETAARLTWDRTVEQTLSAYKIVVANKQKSQ
jgi:glycosyltransferase involved in cell wall biosynthesis